MDPDMNHYDLEHVCADHAIMSADTWRGVYRDAWARYYSDDACRDRAAPRGGERDQSAEDRRCDDGVLGLVADRGRASAAVRLCPAQDPDAAPARAQGRQSARCSIRGGRGTFTPVAGKWAALALRYRSILRRVLADKNGAAYVDEALKPSIEVDHDHDFVAGYADKIPDTYGAPKREAAAAE